MKTGRAAKDGQDTSGGSHAQIPLRWPGVTRCGWVWVSHDPKPMKQCVRDDASTRYAARCAARATLFYSLDSGIVVSGTTCLSFGLRFWLLFFALNEA